MKIFKLVTLSLALAAGNAFALIGDPIVFPGNRLYDACLEASDGNDCRCTMTGACFGSDCMFETKQRPRRVIEIIE